MEKDRLTTFNVKLAADLQKINDDELWNFLQTNEERVKSFFETGDFPQTGIFFAYKPGPEHYREHFLSEIERCREGVIYTLILDFCVGDEKISVEYWARSGFMDSPDSCAVKTSEEIMPDLDDVDEDEVLFSTKHFHLLEDKHTLSIINSMKKNFYKLSEDTFKDISKIQAMRELCLKDENYQIIYIYDIVKW